MNSPAFFNPILAREWRMRWRDWRSYLIVLGVVVALAILCLGVFDWLHEFMVRSEFGGEFYPDEQPFNSIEAALSGTGRVMFRVAMLVQALVWLVLGALLTAGGIARERERGLLEALQLSRFSPLAQTLGRWFSALAFLAFVQIVTLPIWTIALFLGGLGPLDLLVGSAITIGGAALGATLGLGISARAHRPLGAIMTALFVLFVWSALALGIFTEYTWAARPDWIYWLACLHPAALLALFVGPGTDIVEAPRALQKGFILFEFGDVVGPIVFAWGIFVVLGLAQATKWSARTLPNSQWARSNRHVEAWKKRVEAKPESGKTARVLVADLPLEKLARFANPVLAREVRSRFRLRAVGFWLGAVRWMMLIGAVGAWVLGLVVVFEPVAREEFSLRVGEALWVCIVPVFTTLAALSFVRERESGTWANLRLCDLSAWEIVWAKWSAPLMFVFYCALPFGILMLLGVRWGAFLSGTGVSWSALALQLSATVSSYGLVTALALWVSWRAKTPVAAIVWSWALVAFVVWGIPMVLDEYYWSKWTALKWAISPLGDDGAFEVATWQDISILSPDGYNLAYSLATVLLTLGILALLARDVARERRRG